jgi:glycosyltransferase involved in cell wall biosynthesis
MFDFAIHGSNVGDFQEEIHDLGGVWYFFPKMRKNPVKYRKAWRMFWKTHAGEYCAFHFHTNSLANIIAIDEAARAGVPIRIIHSHSSMANKGRLQWLNDFLHKLHQKQIPNLATHLFACSDKAASWLFGGMQIGSLPVVQINNGIDIEKFHYNELNRNHIRKALGLEGMKVVGHVGSFLPVKNHKFIVDVIEKAYEMDPSIRCLFIGQGGLFEEIKNVVASKKLNNVILFLGIQSNVHEWLSAMDIFVMPSLYEGLPVSLIEVQANGLPAIVSDTITSSVKLQKNMYYKSLSDGPIEWAKEIIEVINNKCRANNSNCVADAGFDINETAQIYEKIILSDGENIRI